MRDLAVFSSAVLLTKCRSAYNYGLWPTTLQFQISFAVHWKSGKRTLMARLKDLKSQIVSEFRGGPFPEQSLLTIPEYDNITPEEDWTAGLPVVLRGIQNEDWPEIAHGIAIVSAGRKLSKGIGRAKTTRPRNGEIETEELLRLKRKTWTNGCRKN